MAADSRQGSSSHHVGRSGHEKAALQNDEVFEQRRLRHITSVLLRNVKVPSSSSTVAASALPRPRPRRSVSTASTSSVSTIRRAPSVKSLQGKSRGRTSSVSSSYHGNSGGIDDETYLQSDLTALRKEIGSRLCRTFITLSSLENDEELYRSGASTRDGINFEWGRAPSSISDVDGISLNHTGDKSAEEGVRIRAWYKRQESSEKGKGREDDDTFFVTQGSEEEEGWSLLWQQNVDLHQMAKLSEDPSTSSIPQHPNTVLLGLSYPLSQIQPLEKEDGEEVERIKAKGLQERSNAIVNQSKGNRIYYYVALSQRKNILAEPVPSSDKSKEEKRLAIQAKLKNGELVRGYQIEDILRLLQMQRELCQHHLEVSASQRQSNSILESNDGPVEKELLCAEQKERLAVLRKQKEVAQENTKLKRKSVQERTEAMNRRRARLEMARRALTKEKASYNDLQVKLKHIDEQCRMIKAKAYARRVVLLRQLEFIYPIDLVDGASLLFSIVGVPLANRVLEDDRVKAAGENDDVVSSALGLVSQVVGLMSIYLDTPVHYPIATAGSRSIIQDSISVMSGPRIFPLYSKGVEIYRFEYAIFLLNKDIEQLMNHFDITILDIRNTLPNLKNSIVTMSASSQQSSSRLSRKNMIGSETISLKADRRGSVDTATVVTSALEDQLHQHQHLHHQNSKHQSSKDEKAYRGGGVGGGVGGTWGMNLLGWGHGHSRSTSGSHHTLQPSPLAAPSPAPLPTVRGLGASK